MGNNPAALVRAGLRQLRQGLPNAEFTRSIYPRGAVFVHVPKCGGTSVEEGLRRAYPLSRIRVDSERSAAAAKALLPDGAPTRDVLGAASLMRSHVLEYVLGCGYACITGHAPLRRGVIEAFGDRYGFVTLLRDPVARFKSHYAYSYRSGRHGEIAEALPEFLDTPRARDIAQLYLKYFALIEPGREVVADAAITQAKATLNGLAVVGFVDDMTGFADDLTSALGRKVNIGHANQGQRKNKTQVEFPAELEDRIRALCAPDIEIYAWARQRFGAREPV
ncbi:MAG: hypothetical protein JWM33_3505 [Caulobacteraceae bacterium]|nr:hypothetical protein [Caulobacteraceae bacterium]